MMGRDSEMFIVSDVLNFIGKLGGPKFSLKLGMWKIAIRRNFEVEYYKLDTLVPKGLAALDIGANEGYYSGRLAQLCPQVFAFEPIPRLADELKRKVPGNVVVHQLAVSNSVGSATLRIPTFKHAKDFGTATIEAGNLLQDAIDCEIVNCQTVTLDGFIQGKIGVIKIDVEGHDLAVLQGARELILRDRPVLLVESENRHHGGAPENIFQFMRGLNYSVFCISQGRLYAVHDFDLALHQNINDMAVGGKNENYINNFIFLPAL